VPKCLKTLRHWYRNVSRHFGKVRQASSRQIGLRRVNADPCVQDRVQLLRHITPIAQHASVDVTSSSVLLSLVVSLVLSRLDYGSATLAGLPGNQLDRLQSVMNAAARLGCSARKYEHITPLLCDLHWLQMPERIEFKLSVLVFRCLHERATSCGGRGYKKEAAIFADVCPLSHHLRVVRRLVTARSSSLRHVPGTLCHPASLFCWPI